MAVIVEDGLVDVTDWVRGESAAGSLPEEEGHWDSHLAAIMDAPDALRDFIAAHRNARISLETVELLAPLVRPGKIIAVGVNYLDHAKEAGRSATARAEPRLLGIFPSSIGGPRSAVQAPPTVRKLDFEAELAVVIGKPGKHIPEAAALDHVLGYMAGNDLSAREYQFDVHPPQTTRAKSMDGFTPLGPWLTTADDIPDPQDLWVRCWVNDTLAQDGHTSHMLHGVASLISQISKEFSLHTGDLILTGTPAGCGAFRDPPRYLQTGDVVRTEIEKLGQLINRII